MAEHVVQIGIGIDDEAIKKSIEKTAEKEIKAEIKQAVVNKIFRAYSRDANPKWDDLSYFAEMIIRETLEDHMPEIIEATSKKYAELLMKRKVTKELLDNVHE